jgi:hypothetical protein
VPSLERFARFSQAIGIFIAGSIVGAAIYMSLHQHLFNTIWLEKYEYQEKIKDLEDQMKSIRRLQGEQGIVAKVNVHVESEEGKPPLDSVIQKELEAKLRTELKFLIGKKTSEIQENRDVYRKLLADRVYYGVQGKDFRVKVHALFINGTQLTYWLTASDIAKAPTLSDGAPKS